MTGPRVLLLDVMDTLVQEPFFERAPAFLGLSLRELMAAKHPTAWCEFERDEIDEAELWRRFFRDGRAFDHQGLKRTLTGDYRWVPGMEALLGTLRAQGHALHALSNYPVWYREIEAQLGLSRYLEWSFVSCHTHVRKPDPRAFQGAVEALGVPAGTCLFVDDREENCAAARGVGLEALRFVGAPELQEELGRRGVLG
jgi:HAD superfamily hydrolase (TIGR01509 family)